MSRVVVVAASLGATAFFALSTALKHRSAVQADGDPDAPAGTVSFLRRTVVNPLWLGGMLADLGGVALQVTALHLGALAVVQPLMITALLFSLVLNHRVAGTRISGAEFAGGAVLVGALVAFLYVSGASSPRITGEDAAADRGVVVAVAVIAPVVAVLCVLVARLTSRTVSAALIGSTVGLTYACSAALVKSASNVLVAHGLGSLLLSWQLYLAAVVAVVGVVLAQLAFRAGPLRFSLPTIATVDPLVSILLGVLVYDEHLRPGPLAVTGEVGCLVVLTAAAVFLSRLSGEEQDAAGAS